MKRILLCFFEKEKEFIQEIKGERGIICDLIF